MSQTTTTARQRKPRSKPERVLNYNDRTGILAIHVGKLCNCYFVEPIASDWGTAFKLEKFGSEAETYHVCIDAQHGDSCECRGHLQHGHRTVCKHVAAVKKLQELGKLPHRSTGQLAKNDPPAYADEHTDAECGYQQEAERTAGVNLVDIIDEYV